MGLSAPGCTGWDSLLGGMGGLFLSSALVSSSFLLGWVSLSSPWCNGRDSTFAGMGKPFLFWCMGERFLLGRMDELLSSLKALLKFSKGFSKDSNGISIRFLKGYLRVSKDFS